MGVTENSQAAVFNTLNKYGFRHIEWVRIEPDSMAVPAKAKLKYEVHLTEHCNLNCKGCYHFSPLAKEEYLDVYEYERDCIQLSMLYNGEASQILLLGGEPLLHPDINTIIITTRKYFPKAEILIVTNGILLAKIDKSFWTCCHDNNIVIAPTQYPIDIDYANFEEMAIQNRVEYRYFNEGTGEKELSYSPLDLQGNQNEDDNFFHCYRAGNCVTLSHGRLYTCIMPAHVHHFDEYYKLGLPSFISDGIDIYSVTTWMDIAEFLSKPISMCKYCDRTRSVSGIEWGQSKKNISEWI